MQRTKSLLYLFIGLLFYACGNRNHQDVSTGTVSIDQAPSYQLIEKFKISEFNNGDFFGYINKVFVGADSTIIVGDISKRKIQLFNYDGTYKNYLGGTGAGPGEFRRISNLNLLTPDTLLAVDISSARLSFYTLNDKEWVLDKMVDYPQTPRTGFDAGIYGFRNFHRIKDGYIGEYESTISTFKPNDDHFIKVCFLKFGNNLQPLTTAIPVCYDKLELIVYQSTSATEEIVSAMPIPEGYQTLFSVTREGDIITNWTENRTLSIYSVHSTATHEFEYHSARIPITSKMTKTLLEEANPKNGNSYFRDRDIAKRIPNYRGYATQISVDNKHQIWILTRTTDDNLEWFIYDFNGTLTGKVLHPGGQLTHIHKNRVYIINDSEMEPGFSVYEIQKME